MITMPEYAFYFGKLCLVQFSQEQWFRNLYPKDDVECSLSESTVENFEDLFPYCNYSRKFWNKFALLFIDTMQLP